MENYITHYKDVVEELDNPLPPMPHKPQLNFWPSTTYTTKKCKHLQRNCKDAIPKNDCRDAFFGIAHDKPRESHNSYKELF